ncbi:MAG: type II toxin-antitoxin system VapC family toxin [Pleurocapsa minor GSE-CHR-MK-17-07R]|jgi:predicted nucleic acid-binding protein|nr:type II toxin-antitoxin system VapC family toxin [Pleurocapsa minor GSE-CHR-MK 17-07R]
MPYWVIDAGVFIVRALDEPLAGTADQCLMWMWQHSYQIAAPTLFRYEITSVLRKAVHQGRIAPDAAPLFQRAIFAHDITYFLDDLLLARAQEIAAALNMPTAYDAQYVAVGERLGAPVWTADRKFAAAAASYGVRWLGDFTPDAFPV